MAFQGSVSVLRWRLGVHFQVASSWYLLIPKIIEDQAKESYEVVRNFIKDFLERAIEIQTLSLGSNIFIVGWPFIWLLQAY